MTAERSRPYTTARGVARLRDSLNQRDLAVVRQVAGLRLMSARQIGVVHFPVSDHASEKAAIRARQRVLARLCRERLLMSLTRRIGGVRAGSAGLVLTLGPVGQRLLVGQGPRRRTYEPAARFFDHSLAVSQLVVDLVVASRAGELDVLSLEPEPRCWRTFAGSGGRQVLRPDLGAVLGAQEYELHWFCEIDRASESLPTVLKKCRLYAAYYQAGVEQAKHGVFPRVCWIAPDERRAERLREVIGRAHALPGGLFVVTTSEWAVGALCSLQEGEIKGKEVRI